jgi:hypothetical protein
MLCFSKTRDLKGAENTKQLSSEGYRVGREKAQKAQKISVGRSDFLRLIQRILFAHFAHFCGQPLKTDCPASSAISGENVWGPHFVFFVANPCADQAGRETSPPLWAATHPTHPRAFRPSPRLWPDKPRRPLFMERMSIRLCDLGVEDPVSLLRCFVWIVCLNECRALGVGS